MPEGLLRDGRYELRGKLGEGSQGTTFDALDRSSGRGVAIKRFSVRGAKSWKDVELAEREANVLSGLSHPRLPKHIEHFEEEGSLYLVMEKIEGESLAKLAKQGGALGRKDVLSFLRDAADILDYLHGRSPPVIHRDINPKNVIRRPDGTFALVDFGAVRDRLKPEGGSTVVGTFGYMAPEQFQGRAVPASDVYAVGATALRLLTGAEPENLPHKGLAIDVRGALGPAGDPVLQRVLERALEPDPDRRAASLSRLLSESRATETGRPREAPRSGEPFEYAQAEVDEAMRNARESLRDVRRFEHEWRRNRRHRRRGRRHRGPIHGPPRLMMLLGLDVAMLMVAVVLGFAVPLVLTLLSVVFGRPLRDAARRVRESGLEARESMQRARRFLTEGNPPPDESASHDEAARVRFEDAAEAAEEAPRPPRRRVEQPEDTIDTDGEEVPGPRTGRSGEKSRV